MDDEEALASRKRRAPVRPRELHGGERRAHAACRGTRCSAVLLLHLESRSRRSTSSPRTTVTTRCSCAARRCGCYAALPPGTGLNACGHQVVDPYELVLLKLPPPPLAPSWGRMIQPYCPAAGARNRMRRARFPVNG